MGFHPKARDWSCSVSAAKCAGEAASTEMCKSMGELLLSLSRTFHFSERSGVNLKGEYNAESCISSFPCDDGGELYSSFYNVQHFLYHHDFDKFASFASAMEKSIDLFFPEHQTRDGTACPARPEILSHRSLFCRMIPSHDVCMPRNWYSSCTICYWMQVFCKSWMKSSANGSPDASRGSPKYSRWMRTF